MDKQLALFIRNTLILVPFLVSLLIPRAPINYNQFDLAATRIELFARMADGVTVPPASIITKLDKQTMRNRVVRIDPAAVNALRELIPAKNQANNGHGLTLHLALFGDANYMMRVNQIERDLSGGIHMSGVITGIQDSQVSLEIQNDTLLGDIFIPGKNIQIRPSVNGYYIVKQIDQSGFPDEHPPIPISLPSSTAVGRVAATQLPTHPKVTDDDGSRIDILVVYDQSAAEKAGGTAAILALIKNLIAVTNDGYAISLVNLRVFLTNAAAVDYDESNFDWPATLQHLVDPNDGLLDNVPGLRDTAHADLTVLLVGYGDGYCGISGQMQNLSPDFASNAYAVVNIDCAIPELSFSHELGFLMGSQVDHGSTGGQTGIFNYSYGYQDPGGSFRTIMANKFGCQAPCPRINYWSNPLVTYNNLPTGIDPEADNAADNSKSLDGAAVTVANFRDGPSPTPPTNLIASSVRPNPLKPAIDLTWSDNSPDETRFDIGRSPHDQDQWTIIGSAGEDVTNFADSEAPINQLFDYRVNAHSGNGDSDYSNRVTASTFLAPAKPLIHSAAAINEDQVNLMWDPMPGSSDTVGMADQVVIERTLTGSDNWLIQANLPGNATSFVDTQVFCGLSYSYRVQAVNTGGASPYSDNTSISIPCRIPDTPGSLLAGAISPDRINLTWSDCHFATSYTIERSVEDTGVWENIGTLSGHQTTYFDHPLKSGTVYSYRIMASNLAGSSDYSNIASATTPWYKIWAPIIKAL